EYMMQQYNSLIIKPNSSSIGRGIMKLERTEDGWKLLYPSVNNHKIWKTSTFKQSMPKVLINRICRKPYVIQQCLPLATYDGRPFDLRVSVQRNINGGWQVSGIAGKVAKKAAFLTNVAQGGT